MNRRRLAIAVAALAVLAALAAWWKLHSGAGADDADERSAAGAGTRARDREQAAGRRIDVATVARGAIAGTVRDPQGAAIAGAQVCARGRSQHLSDEDLREPRCGETGADGRYRLGGLLPARYSVHASAPGFTPASYRGANRSHDLPLTAGQERGGIDIVLRPGGVELVGTVKDIGGGPVEGAWVYVLAMAWEGVSATAHARSGADGSFRVWVAPGQVHISARADGYADGREAARAPGRATVLLTPESVLAGRVVEAGSGAAVAGARVTVGDDGGPFAAGEDSLPDVQAAAVTDDDGRFRIARLPPGRYKPAARADRGHGQARHSVLLGLGQTATDVVIEIHPAVQVTGRVVAADRTPCAEGLVDLFDQKTERRAGGMIEDGRVAIDAVLPGSYEVRVWCRGFRPEEEYPDLAVAAAPVPEQTWTVRSGGRIRGTVRSSAGAPAAQVGVTVRLQGEQRRPMDAWRWAHSDADGAFEVAGLHPGSYKVGLESSEPAAGGSQVVTVADGGESTVELVVAEGGSLAGEVVDERGRPVAGAGVQAMSTTIPWSGDHGAQTADDGTFAIGRLRPGPHRVVAHRPGGWEQLRAPGQSDDEAEGEKVTVVAGQTARVRMVVESPSGVIRGRVVDGQGAPITDAFVDAARQSESATAAEGQARHAIRWSWSRDPALTDTDGAFTLDKLTPGTYTVRAFRRGGGEALAEGVAVGGSVTLTIRRTGSVSGTARAGGGPPETLTVALRDRKTGFARSETFFRTGGQFAMRDLPAGSFEVAVRAAEGNGRAEVVLAEGQDLTGVTVALEASATLTGRVVSLSDGSPIPGCLIHVEGLQGASGGRTFTDKNPMSGADGRFEVKNAPAGRVEVTAFPLDQESGHFMGRRRVTVEGGRMNDIGDLRVPRRRLKASEPRGDIGFELKQTPPDADPDKETLTVALVRPDGPAAGSGLRPGDVIVSVDGVEVRGDLTLYWSMTTVPPGTALTLGLESGASARITAGPAR